MTTPSELDRLRARFDGVAQTIGDRLAAVSPRVVALVAKWSKEDLVPGLSDMDFRVVCDEATTTDDWVEIDWHVGRIHRQMVEEHPEWNRINEHTPGAGVSLAELQSERFHHPEYPVWTVWWGRDDWAKQLKSRTLTRPLGALDEHYHLARFLLYYSPYIHGIDPGINLGDLEPKYALHSRCWHYFAPPMLSAATLLARRHFLGKRAALHWLVDNGLIVRQVQAVLNQVDAHYDTNELSDPVRLEHFEQLLFTAFKELMEPVRHSIQHLDLPSFAGRDEWKLYLLRHPAEPLTELLENVRFARLRAGRYFFYLNAPQHFSTDRQLLDEQKWTRKLVDSTMSLIGAIRPGDNNSSDTFSIDPRDLQENLETTTLDFMNRLAKLQGTDGIAREQYAQAVDVFPQFYRWLERTFQFLQATTSCEPGNGQPVYFDLSGESAVTTPLSSAAPAACESKS